MFISHKFSEREEREMLDNLAWRIWSKLYKKKTLLWQLTMYMYTRTLYMHVMVIGYRVKRNLYCHGFVLFCLRVTSLWPGPAQYVRGGTVELDRSGSSVNRQLSWKNVLYVYDILGIHVHFNNKVLSLVIHAGSLWRWRHYRKNTWPMLEGYVIFFSCNDRHFYNPHELSFL